GSRATGNRGSHRPPPLRRSRRGRSLSFSSHKLLRCKVSRLVAGFNGFRQAAASKQTADSTMIALSRCPFHSVAGSRDGVRDESLSARLAAREHDEVAPFALGAVEGRVA